MNDLASVEQLVHVTDDREWVLALSDRWLELGGDEKMARCWRLWAGVLPLLPSLYPELVELEKKPPRRAERMRAYIQREAFQVEKRTPDGVYLCLSSNYHWLEETHPWPRVSTEGDLSGGLEITVGYRVESVVRQVLRRHYTPHHRQIFYFCLHLCCMPEKMDLVEGKVRFR